MKWKKTEAVLEKKAEKEFDVFDSTEKLDVADIWQAANMISGGFGFWGSGTLFRHNNPKKMVKAWVDALREKGYKDIDIVFYGDWTDGRHIADHLEANMSYDDFKKIVSESARTPEEVNEENRRSYQEKAKTIEFWFRKYTED